jgi:hypothetical protein
MEDEREEIEKTLLNAKSVSIAPNFYSILLCVWGDQGLNSGLHACKVGILPPEPNFQSILLWLFWSWGLMIYLPGLASNCNSHLSLPNS